MFSFACPFRSALAAIAACATLSSTSQQLLSGPMPGYATHTECAVWVQVSEPCELEMLYWPSDEPGQKQSARVDAMAENANTAHFIVGNLKPGTEYHYQIRSGKKTLADFPGLSFSTQRLWQHREDPPSFRIALGSCAYFNEPEMDRPGKGYGGDYGIFQAMAEDEPDIMLWLGDNVYFREPDWDSWSGMLHRYTHDRQTPELQALLRSCHHYAIWDDHDFGPNDSNGSFIHKERSKKAFELFWANPSYGIPGMEGITTSFSYNDADFFLLDNRTFRTESDMSGTGEQILGKQQVEWLIQALSFSRAPFKFVIVGGQFLSDVKIYENHANYEEERAWILGRIEEEKISGVIFLSGDRHSTSISESFFEDGRKIFDFTCSPLTSTAYDHSAEENSFLVDGSGFYDRNYGIIDISGAKGDRTATLRILDKTGNEVFAFPIHEKDLRKVY